MIVNVYCKWLRNAMQCVMLVFVHALVLIDAHAERESVVIVHCIDYLVNRNSHQIKPTVV